MKNLTNDEYLAIKDFAEELIACFERTGNYQAIRTINLHLDLARFTWEASADDMAQALGEKNDK